MFESIQEKMARDEEWAEFDTFMTIIPLALAGCLILGETIAFS